MNQVKIGKFIAELRKSKNMTQEQLGEKLGVSFKTISKWENGRGMPELSTLKPLSEELGISINELLSGEKIEKEKYQETFEENMLMAISYNNKINDKNNIIGYFLLIIGYLLILFGIVVFNHDSHFCSFSIIIGVLLTTFGFGNFIKKQKNSVKVIALIMYFVVFMGIMFTLDFVSVKYINNPPIFAHKITTGEESVLYETLFYDVYKYSNNYIKKIVENDAIPLLIPLIDDKLIEETLDMCDGLLLPGGSYIKEVNFKVIDYFYKRKKPILGICMGMQTLAMYSVNIENKERKRIIKPIDTGVDHWPIEVIRKNLTTLAHKDYVNEDSLLYKILDRKEIIVNSLHHNTITEVGSSFKVVAHSEDNLIEAIEYNGNDRFVLGVQCHPEVLPQYNNIFKTFISRCKDDISM